VRHISFIDPGSHEILVRNFLKNKNKKAGLASGLSGDEVKYAFTEALRRATRPTWGRCPSRAASKTSMPTLNGQRNLDLHFLRPVWPEKGSNFFSKNIRRFSRQPGACHTV
jgi:hypothetical protein